MSERPAWRWVDEICPFADAPCPESAEQADEEFCTLWTGAGCALDLEPERESSRPGPVGVAAPAPRLGGRGPT